MKTHLVTCSYRIQSIKEYLERHDELLIFSLSFLIEILFGLMLVYKYGNTFFNMDSASYLYHARTAIDNGIYSGLASLVGTWLPFFELTQVPFVKFDILYTTGFSGTIVNAFMTGGICVYLYRLIGGKGNRFSVLAPVIFLSNIYALIYGAIPMTEQASVFFLVAASYYFKSYLNTGELRKYILCSVMLVFGSLTKYEFWFVVIFTVLVFSLNEVAVKRNTHRIGYACLPLIGIMVWLFTNLMIHRDMFWFNDNPSSNFMQTTFYPPYFTDDILLTLKHAFIQIDMTYGVLLYLAVVSIILLIILGKNDLVLISAMFFIPSIVNVVLMYQGHSAGWQRYFYTQFPGIIFLAILLLENAILIFSFLNKNEAVYIKGVFDKYRHNFDVTLLILFMIAGITVAGAALSMSADKSVDMVLFKPDNRPWIYQGLDISNDRIFFKIENEIKPFITDFSFDFLNRTKYRSYREVKNLTGTEKILMPSYMVSDSEPGIRADMFSVSEGISPEQLIDGFDYKEYQKIMKEPWNYVRYVIVVPIENRVASNISKWYGGEFYLYNFYYNETWRSEFLDRYEPVLDDMNFKLFKLKGEI